MYNMQLNTGYAGKPHVTAENCADLNRGLLGSDSYVLPVGAQFEVELVTNNLLKIKDGCGCMQGRQVSIAKGQTDEITIENGTQGEKRIDLVVIRYNKNADTGIETAIPFLIKGIPSENNPVRPQHLEGDIRGGDLTADWPLYELYLDGISVTDVKPLFDVLMSVNELNRNFKESVYADGCIMVEFGALPNSGNKEIEIPLPAGVREYWIDNGWAYGSDKRRYPLPYVDVSTWGYSISCMINPSGKLQISTKSDWTGYNAQFLIAYKLQFFQPRESHCIGGSTCYVAVKYDCISFGL